ncbi:SurA N-terminal domain-containing protein [Paenibacillus sp. GCM10027626]|uniref:SurA N-terminal domain-containing protein n=1 Tax=Paenibacillus sp. GCM10027626 TaxID=3273411 RepID=UPI0036336794
MNKFIHHAVIRCCSVVLLAVIVSLSGCSFAGKNDRSESENPYVAEGPNFKIDRQRFDLYKANMELAAEWNNVEQSLSDEQLLDVLIKNELAVQEAKKLEIVVTADEVKEYIAYQRSTLELPAGVDEQEQRIRKLMDDRIAQSGLTEDEFWTSEDTRRGYEDAIYLSKLISYLVDNEKIGGREQFDTYQNELLQVAKAKSLIKIYL